MLVLRDDVYTTPWCEAPIVHADHTTAVRHGGETSFSQGAGKCARCNQTKEAPGWHTQVNLRPRPRPRADHHHPYSEPFGAAVRADHVPDSDLLGPGDRHVHGNCGDVCHQGDRRDTADCCDRWDTLLPDDYRDADHRDDNSRYPARVVQVTTPMGHSYVSEPPPLLGWGTTVTRPETLEALADGQHVVTADSVRPPESRTRPAASSRSRMTADAGGDHRPTKGRKRRLRRPRTVPNARVAREPRRLSITSHLERRLCRYLT
jgi:hypothetical protein